MDEPAPAAARKRSKRYLVATLGAALFLLGIIAYLHISNPDGFLPAAVGGFYLLPLLVASALVDSTNPCAFSVLLLTIAFLFSIGRLRSDILKAGGLYIFGIFLVYVLIGLGILQTLEVFNVPHVMSKVGAVIIIAFGAVSIVNHLFPKFPLKLGIPHSAHAMLAKVMEKASFPTAFGLGVLVGLFEFPCAGGPYLSVLALLHDKSSFWEGFGYLLLFNIIFVTPLTIMLLIASNPALLEKAQTLRRANVGKARLWGGVAMIIIGLIMFTL